MRAVRRLRLAPALALVIGLGLAAPSASAATSTPDPIDQARTLLFGGVSTSSSAAGATGLRADGGVSTQSTPVGARIGHVLDAANDVEGFTFDGDFETVDVPARYARTIDITRFGYHFGQRTAKFTIRTRDLRAVKGAQTLMAVNVITRSRAGTDSFTVFATGNYSGVQTASGWTRPCAERSVTHDATRNTVTFRVPMRCLTGKATPTSMQPAAGAALYSDTYSYIAMDETYYARRADVRS